MAQISKLDLIGPLNIDTQTSIFVFYKTISNVVAYLSI